MSGGKQGRRRERGGKGGGGGWEKAQQQNKSNACLDVYLGSLPISIASNNGLGKHGDIHSSIALSCKREQKVLCMAVQI